MYSEGRSEVLGVWLLRVVYVETSRTASAGGWDGGQGTRMRESGDRRLGCSTRGTGDSDGRLGGQATRKGDSEDRRPGWEIRWRGDPEERPGGQEDRNRSLVHT